LIAELASWVIKAPLTRRTVALGGRFAPAGPLRLRLRGQGKPPAPAPAMQCRTFRGDGSSTVTVLKCLKDGLRRGIARTAGRQEGNNAPLR